MATVVIGANRGIGLAIVQSLLKTTSKSTKIYATARDPSSATALQSLTSSNANLSILKLDFSSSTACDSLSSAFPANEGIETLIVNAGQHGESCSPTEIDTKNLIELMECNVVGPINVVKALLPLMKKNKGKNVGKILLMSSDAGSITMKQETGGYSGGSCYWITKAALNMYGVSLSNELKSEGISVRLLHPGWIQTDMGGKNAPLTMDQALPGIMKVIHGMTLENTGQFLNYKGEEVPF